jgi:hypothetical protein
MSAAASPGRTWPILFGERRVHVLAAAFAAPFLHGRCRVAHVPGLDGGSTSAGKAYQGDQDYSRRQLSVERYADRRLDSALGSVSVDEG